MTLTSAIPPTGRNFGLYIGNTHGKYPDIVALLVQPGQEPLSSHEMVGLSTILTRLPGYAFAAVGPDMIVLYGSRSVPAILGHQDQHALIRTARSLIKEFYAGAHLARSPLTPDALPYLGHPVSFSDVPAPWTGLMPVPVRLSANGELRFSLPQRQAKLALPGIEHALASHRPALRFGATYSVLTVRPLSPEMHLQLAATIAWEVLRELRFFELSRRRIYRTAPLLPVPKFARELFR